MQDGSVVDVINAERQAWKNYQKAPPAERQARYAEWEPLWIAIQQAGGSPP